MAKKQIWRFVRKRRSRSERGHQPERRGRKGMSSAREAPTRIPAPACRRRAPPPRRRSAPPARAAAARREQCSTTPAPSLIPWHSSHYNLAHPPYQHKRPAASSSVHSTPPSYIPILALPPARSTQLAPPNATPHSSNPYTCNPTKNTLPTMANGKWQMANGKWQMSSPLGPLIPSNVSHPPHFSRPCIQATRIRKRWRFPPPQEVPALKLRR
jgi:hypothetical protein